MANSERLTPVQWTVCVIAAIGFAFDIYELLMLPLIVGPALQELGGLHARHAGVRPLVRPVVLRAGCVRRHLRLLGGYLTDRFGRRRVLTWSILLYAFSAFLAGFSTNLWMLLVLAHDDVHRRVRRVRRRGGLAGRTVRRTASGAKKCWATRRRFRRSAACWWRSSTA